MTHKQNYKSNNSKQNNWPLTSIGRCRPYIVFSARTLHNRLLQGAGPQGRNKNPARGIPLLRPAPQRFTKSLSNITQVCRL